MPTPLTIWSNIALPADLAADFARRLTPHRLIWAADLAATNLTAAGSDAALIEQCDIALGQPNPGDIFAAKKLKLVVLSSAGYTRYDRADLREHCQLKKIAFCNASTVYADPCAQHVLAFMLSAARRLPDAVQAQTNLRGHVMANSFRRSHRDKSTGTEAIGWDSLLMRSASAILGPGTTVLIAGYGAIARRLVEFLAPFGMDVHAFRRTPRGDENCPTHAIADFDKHLPSADHVVNILPLSNETKLFFDAKRLGRMKQGTRFYNIGRGDTVDQPALVKALVSGQVGQAYLDVTTPEPLPANDPLWMAPNCFITPHTAGGSFDEAERQLAHFIDNVRRFERGDTVIDRVF